MNNEVWIVKGVWNYEGDVILGVFKDEENALQCRDNEVEESAHFDGVTVTKWEVK